MEFHQSKKKKKSEFCNDACLNENENLTTLEKAKTG